VSTIREMRPGDIEQVGEIWLTASIEAHDFVPEAFWRGDLENMTTEILPSPKTRGFVFESDGRLDGFVAMGGSHVGALFVRPDEQGRGVGAALLDHVKQLHAELDLTAYQQNVRATRFYEREGFTIAGERTCPHTGCAEYVMRWSRAADPAT